MNKTAKWVTRTAVMLAITVLFQSLRLIIPATSTYIIGSLVNLALIVSVLMIDAKGGLVIAVLAPIIAFFEGFLPQIMPLMILFVAIGNATIVLAYALIYRESFASKVVALAVGAVAKFLVLYALVVKVAVPLIYPAVPDTMKAVLSVNFSWLQLITAAIGGVLALLIIPLLKKGIRPLEV